VYFNQANITVLCESENVKAFQAG